MLVENLTFFNRNGENLNLQLNDDNVWIGTIYFEGISNYLYDNENLFILEESVPNNYIFPTLIPDESIIFEWDNNKNEEIFFIYDVVKDLELNENFINRLTSNQIKYSDMDPVGSGPLDISVPLQVNIGFAPLEEVKYEKTLKIYYDHWKTNTVKEKLLICELSFYGEGIEEDERFRVWAKNFGIKFNKDDANILKEYNIKEALPNYKDLNQIRKELLVNKEHIYPYIGTYKGLFNIINILGYKDLLQIKEYWKNVNSSSSYFNKLTMIDIVDYLDDGKIDGFDLADHNKDLKKGRQYKKTEFLALVYQFTRATDDFDDDGIPLIEETTHFTVSEIFYKLNLLNDKLKTDFLPINVKIKDIIGEFIYFQKLTLSYWPDSTYIWDYQINENVGIASFPSDQVNLTLRALDPLYKQSSTNGIDMGISRINQDTLNPFEIGQKYPRSEIIKIKSNIEEFYNQIRDQRFPDAGARLSWETGDDPERNIGAPVIFSLDLNKLTLFDLRGVQISDLQELAPGLSPYWTLENIDFRNYYEIIWKITKDSPNSYNFEYRGRVIDLHELTHFLPYAGKYRVTIQLIDFYGHISVFSRFITVQEDMTPNIVAYGRFEDKFDYSIKNLSNVQLQDFGASPIYYPKVNVLDNESVAIKINIYKNLIEWISFYKTRYGMGQHINDVELYNDSTNTYLAFNDPGQNHPKKRYWGLGENDIPITINDFRDIAIGSLYWLRITNLVHLDDFNAGFYIQTPVAGGIIKISLFSDYTIPQFSTLEELVVLLNESEHPGIKLFNYEIIDGKHGQSQYIIHAQAEYLSKEMYHILDKVGGFSPASPSPSPNSSNGGNVLDQYTFFLPRLVFSHPAVDYLKSLSPVFDEETLFLLAKTSDLLNGAVQDPVFWKDNKYWKFVNDEQIGYLPTTIDQNAFNINDIKLFEETFTVPENGIVFFVINNLDGKNEFIWKLTNYDSGEEIVRTRSVPFFVWKFKDLGQFSLSVEVFDNKNTKYVSIVQNFIRVLDKRQYISNIERRLDDRKLLLLKDRV